MQKIYFTADLHFGHKNILKHCPKRIEHVRQFALEKGIDNETFDSMMENDLKAVIDLHDEWLVDMWNNTVKRNDMVYIIGDVSLGSNTKLKANLEKLKGKKYLILGNHDGSIKGDLVNYFEQITQMKEINLKSDLYKVLKYDMRIYMCHYRNLVWPEKHYGSIHLCGHSHGLLDDYNMESPDLCVDVGIDGKLADYRILSLKDIQDFFLWKTSNVEYSSYARYSSSMIK